MPSKIRYVPFLKGRQGEFSALDEITELTRLSIQPLVEVVPLGDRDNPEIIVNSCHKAADKLSSKWRTNRAFVDLGLLDTGVDLDNGGAIFVACHRAEQGEVAAIPVVKLDDPERARRDVGTLNSEHGRGACIRLAEDDLDEDPEDLDDAIEALLRDCGLSRGQVDLVLDAGSIDGELVVRALARLMASLIKDLEHVDEYRTLTISSGAFPADLSVTPPWVIGEHPRHDADLWAQVVTRRRVTRLPDFSDYAIAHPLLVTGAPFAPAPQLRYTTSQQYLTLRARRNDPAGNEQFYDVCDAIANHPEFAGAGLGSADSRIANSRNQGPGNPATWRQIGVTHHLDFVVRRLSTLDEP